MHNIASGSRLAMRRRDAAIVEIEQWALDYADRLSRNIGEQGVAVGARIACDAPWEHFDLKVAVLVDERDAGVSHYLVDSGRGIEIFQLERDRLAHEVGRVRGGDVAVVASWPIQLYRSHVTHDPSGLLWQFVTELDRHLVSPAAIEIKVRGHQSATARALSEARMYLSSQRPRAAFVWARVAIYESILRLHWMLGEVPRGYFPVGSRFVALAEQHGFSAFYELFRDAFDLESAANQMSGDWLVCKYQVGTLTGLWDGHAPRFFTMATDRDFSCSDSDGLICAYRMYLPFAGAPATGVLRFLDDPYWARANESLVRFLGLTHVDTQTVSALLHRISEPLPVRSHGRLQFVCSDVGEEYEPLASPRTPSRATKTWLAPRLTAESS